MKTVGAITINVYMSVPEDTGCAYAPSCLSCHLPMCQYDEGFTEWKQKQYDNAVVRAVKALKMSRLKAVKLIAAQFGINARTVYRILERTA